MMTACVQKCGVKPKALNVCDDCRTAFHDEGFIELTDGELAQVLHMGACIADHWCEASAQMLDGTGCDCPCPKG